jgi:hypothetical protein
MFKVLTAPATRALPPLMRALAIEAQMRVGPFALASAPLAGASPDPQEEGRLIAVRPLDLDKSLACGI